MSDEIRVSCPFCAEQILPTAKKCRFCNEILDDDLLASRVSEISDVVRMAGNKAVKGARHILKKDLSRQSVYNPFKRNFPHTGYLAISFFTAGLFIPIYVYHYVSRDRSMFN